MRQYIIRRLMQAVPILLGISLVVFTLAQLAPGDPVDALIPPEAHVSEEVKAKLRTELGLTAPAPIRYLHWLGRAATGRFGYSFSSRKPVSEMVKQRLPATLLLVGFALAISLILGIVTGIIAAVKQYSWVDYLIAFFSLSWLSIPGFFLGLLVIYLFAVKLKWFPAFGISTAAAENVVWDRLRHLILPGMTLGLELTAALTRYVRSSLLEVLNSDYMRTARAKGLRERRVIMRHALPNALIPIITVVGLRLPVLLGGAVVVETVFQWPGLGMLTLGAANQRDYNLVMALAMLTAAVVVASNIIADIAYAVVDPRIRYE